MRSRRSKITRLILIVALLFGCVALYRVVAVYRFRPGHCEALEMAQVRRQPTTPTALRVMTYNIEGHATLIKGDSHIQAIAEVINRFHPDVVGINEAHRNTWQARFGNQVADLERATGMHAVFASNFSVFGGEFGNLILTKGKVIETHSVPLPGTGEPRTLLEATIQTKDGTFSFFVTHTTAWGKLNSATRKTQMECVAANMAASRYPSILVGDMNAEPDSDEVKTFLGESGMRLAATDFAPTHKLMNERIDHVYLTPEWQVGSLVVEDTGPSDHRPVVAELTRGNTP
jgi:endonuclease/exonuclease/phosphatase family metal-dependent hydrolase